MTSREHRCPGPVNRRAFLQAGSVGLGGLGLSDLLRLRAEAARERNTAEPDTAVILIWLQGGPSHMETYDMKPLAPADYRGEFHPMHTAVPGMEICELLPRHAAVADKFNIIRSISHGWANHAGGAGRFLSGRDPKDRLKRTAQYPCLGPIVSMMRQGRRVGVPNYVSSTPRVYGGGEAYLGNAHLPFVVSSDPNSPNFQVRNLEVSSQLADRLDDRLRLMTGFDQLRESIDQSGVMQAVDEFNRRAVNLVTSDQAREAFDLSKEDPRLRDRYGRHTWGQRALLARRLVEAGCSFVTMQMRNPRRPGATGNWDSHAVNCHIFEDTRQRLPIFDQAVSALIQDLYDRGLDKRVMLIVSGEFGRTPRITYRTGTRSGVKQPGRDHWPRSMAVLVSGGGMRTGQVIGSTNAKGEEPQDRPLDPNDLLATVYRFLGIDGHTAITDHSGRPLPILPHGKPIAELV